MIGLFVLASVAAGWADVFAGDDEVVEEDNVGWILRPAVGDVGLKGEGIGL